MPNIEIVELIYGLICYVSIISLLVFQSVCLPSTMSEGDEAVEYFVFGLVNWFGKFDYELIV